MSDEEIEKNKEAVYNLVQAMYNLIKTIITELYNKLKTIMESIFLNKTDKRIQKRINIYLITKNYRIKKKQLKIIVRGIQVYFI